ALRRHGDRSSDLRPRPRGALHGRISGLLSAGPPGDAGGSSGGVAAGVSERPAPSRLSNLLWGPGWIAVALALAWRYACHAAMLLLSLLTEGRPAPSLPDLVLDRLPRVEWIANTNYWLWLLCYIPVALWLWRRNRPAFLHFLYLGGIVSLARGLCVGLT